MSIVDAETVRTYREAGFGGRLVRGKRPAVLVVDFSRGFTDPQSPLGFEMSDAVEATCGLLSVARAANLLVLFTTVAYAPDMRDAGIIVQKTPTLAALQEGSKWAEIDPRLEVRPGELVVVKKGLSALFGTNVSTVMTAARTDTVILCGATTAGCIRATVVDLLQYGFPTLVPRECVAERAARVHEATLFDIGARWADVVTVDEATDYIDTVAGERARA
jgi:nicotinamidase-related amidase